MNQIGWGEEVKEKIVKAQNNKCRELVLVQEQQSSVKSDFIEKYPEACWKYKTFSTFIQAKFNFSNNRTENVNFPIFYSRVINAESPLNVWIHLKYLKKKFEGLTIQINNFYNKNYENYQFNKNQLFEHLPCAAKVGDQWLRAKVGEKVSSEKITVFLIDSGLTRIIEVSNVCRLFSKFGRFPPMAMKCRIEGILIQSLSTDKIDQFQEKLRLLDYFVRCEIMEEKADGSYLVNFYHPTIHNLNICEEFLTKIDEKILKIEKNSNESENEEDSEYEDEEECLELFIREFDRSIKAYQIFENQFEVVHVEHANLIYLTNDQMKKMKKKIENRLENQWFDFPDFPENWLKIGAACCIKEEFEVKRAAVNCLNNLKIEFFLIDEGRFVEIKRDEISRKIRAIPEKDEFTSPPQIVAVSLDEEIKIHFSLIQILRNLLSGNSLVSFHPSKKSKNIPINGNLEILKNQEIFDVKQVLIEILNEKKIDVNCSEVVIFQGNPIFQPFSPLVDFIYRFNCPRAFTRGVYSSSTITAD